MVIDSRARLTRQPGQSDQPAQLALVRPSRTVPLRPSRTVPLPPNGTVPSPPSRTVPLRPGRVVSQSVLDLLGQAQAGLAEAAQLGSAGERYAGAHLAALRATAAVLAARTHPDAPSGAGARRRRRIRSAWDLLCEVAPEMGEWAAFFAAGAVKRAAAEAGVTGAVTAREADDLVRDVETFLAVVTTTVGVRAPSAPRTP